MPDPRLFRPLRRWRIVLVSPQNGENVGSVARLYKNFGYDGGLWIVEPRCEIDPYGDAGKLAREAAQDVLAAARIVPTLAEALAGSSLSLATTMLTLKDRPCEVQGFQVGAFLRKHPQEGEGALVFGREDNGLTNAECSLCTGRWAFPMNPEFPSLNLAQAVASASTALRMALEEQAPETDYKSSNDESIACFEEIDGLVSHVEEMLHAIDFERGVPLDYPLRLIRRLANRSELTTSDVHVLRGICRRTLNALKQNQGKNQA